eukprot:m.211701 g.211701  ORF g.211701 m.211701 type:complete len:76 (+) comp15495_c1_seq1:1031-1258(+)
MYTVTIERNLRASGAPQLESASVAFGKNQRFAFHGDLRWAVKTGWIFVAIRLTHTRLNILVNKDRYSEVLIVFSG